MTACRNRIGTRVVSLAEIPQAHLVKIMQAQRAGYAVYQDGIGDGVGYDVAEIELEEEDCADDGEGRGNVSDFDEDEKDQSDQEEERSD